MMRKRRSRMGLRGILPLALLAGAVMMFVRRNRNARQQSKHNRLKGQHNPMDYDSRQKLQREVEIMEEADNRMFDAFPQD